MSASIDNVGCAHSIHKRFSCTGTTPTHVARQGLRRTKVTTAAFFFRPGIGKLITCDVNAGELTASEVTTGEVTTDVETISFFRGHGSSGLEGACRQCDFFYRISILGDSGITTPLFSSRVFGPGVGLTTTLLVGDTLLGPPLLADDGLGVG